MLLITVFTYYVILLTADFSMTWRYTKFYKSRGINKDVYLILKNTVLAEPSCGLIVIFSLGLGNYKLVYFSKQKSNKYAIW